MEKNGIAGDGDDPEDGESMIFTPGYEWKENIFVKHLNDIHIFLYLYLKDWKFYCFYED